ncbi:MAG: PKD domain-containing protein [Deltaproteobacteria bacterium]|nr:PKD domain-containing protein [Deltaproteobacteria bacterium]MBK9648494.1 PKD domain-containing protein [Deltaproteobacteria bacterium]
MLRLLLTLLLVSCAAEVAPRAEPGDPRVMPVGAVAALDGSYSEGDDLSFAWSVEPAEGAVLNDAESPFATLTAEAPGLYTLRLEVCDAAGRCDVAETWARVDDPASAKRITDWGIDEFAGVESGAGALSAISPTKSFCKQCFENASKTSSEWEDFCRELEKQGASKEQRAKCWAHTHKDSGERGNYCRDMGCRG